MRKTTSPATGRDTEFTWTPAHLVALSALCLAQLLEALDITVVNVALPALRTGLGFTGTTLQWVITSYTVCFGGVLLLGGKIGDRYGFRRVFIAGTVLFALASLGCAVAGSAGMLVGARAVQGVAAGFVSPMTLALLAAIFPEGPARTRAVTAWGVSTALSGSLGFVVGGLLVDGPGWRWIFAVNPVVCVPVIAAVLRFVPRDVAGERRGRFDVVGAIVSTAAVGLLVYGVSQVGERAWSSAAVLMPIAAAAVLLCCFVLQEARTPDPLIPLRLFTIRTVTAANIAQALISGGIYALFYLLSLELHGLFGRGATGTGLALLPFSVLLLVCAGAGPLLVRYTGFRGSIAAGGLLGAAGLVLLGHTVTVASAWPAVMLPSLVVAAGFALTFVPVTVAAVAGVPAARHGVAAALVNVTRTLGGAVGLAVVAAVATHRTDALTRTGHGPADALGGGSGWASTWRRCCWCWPRSRHCCSGARAADSAWVSIHCDLGGVPNCTETRCSAVGKTSRGTNAGPFALGAARSRRQTPNLGRTCRKDDSCRRCGAGALWIQSTCEEVHCGSDARMCGRGCPCLCYPGAGRAGHAAHQRPFVRRKPELSHHSQIPPSDADRQPQRRRGTRLSAARMQRRRHQFGGRRRRGISDRVVGSDRVVALSRRARTRPPPPGGRTT